MYVLWRQSELKNHLFVKVAHFSTSSTSIYMFKNDIFQRTQFLWLIEPRKLCKAES